MSQHFATFCKHRQKGLDSEILCQSQAQQTDTHNLNIFPFGSQSLMVEASKAILVKLISY